MAIAIFLWKTKMHGLQEQEKNQEKIHHCEIYRINNNNTIFWFNTPDHIIGAVNTLKHSSAGY